MSTLAEAQSHLATARAAYTKALGARSQTLDGRTIQRQDLTALRAELQHWEREVERLTALAAGASVSRVRGLVLRS